MSYATAYQSSPVASHGPVIALIPAFNEELAIGSVVLRTNQYVSKTIVVDDGSTDRTAEVAELAGAEVVRIPLNTGKAHAMMVGFERSRSYQPAAVVMLDGDGQHNPDEIPAVVAPVLKDATDLVIGSRFLDVNSKIPVYRQIGQKTLDFATNMSSGGKGNERNGNGNGQGNGNGSRHGHAAMDSPNQAGIAHASADGTPFRTSDSQSGFRAISRRALHHLDFYSDGYNIESDMLAHFMDRGLKISEIPITVNYDMANGHKKHPVSHGMDVLGHIVGLIGYKRPLISFGLPGIVTVILGLVSGSLAFAEYYQTSKFSYILSMVSVLFLILGLLLMTTALILNSLTQIVKMESGRS